eukprot:363920-Chlamydomonas_euryale.AAC.4
MAGRGGGGETCCGWWQWRETYPFDHVGLCNAHSALRYSSRMRSSRKAAFRRRAGGSEGGVGGRGALDKGSWRRALDEGRWTKDAGGGRWTRGAGRRNLEEGRWTRGAGRRKLEEGRWTRGAGRRKLEEGRWTGAHTPRDAPGADHALAAIKRSASVKRIAAPPPPPPPPPLPPPSPPPSPCGVSSKRTPYWGGRHERSTCTTVARRRPRVRHRYMTASPRLNIVCPPAVAAAAVACAAAAEARRGCRLPASGDMLLSCASSCAATDASAHASQIRQMAHSPESRWRGAG